MTNPQSNYRRLDAAKIVATATALERRIGERFPQAGLAALAREFTAVAKAASDRSADIRRPNYRMRTLATLALVALPLTVVLVEQATAGASLGRISGLAEFIQVLEASLGAVVFLGAAIFFVLSLETRVKRRKTLDAIHELRSMAHIVDMHQLLKDPERVQGRRRRTPSSPQISTKTHAELERYLDYCSELLSLIGKVAALYVQDFPDADSVAAVDEVETLTTGLSRKIWQKIDLVERFKADEAEPAT